jgi:FkbM family methyltransferase
MSIQSKALKALRNPFLIPQAIKNRISHFYKLHIIKDEFTVAVTKWFRDRGDQTLRLDYPLSPQSIVFDLGGYKGDFAYEMNKKYGCFVYVFEPVRDFYEECARRFKGNDKVSVLNYGLSDETTTAYISDEDNGSSVIKNNTENCEQITLKQFQEEFQRLKLDAIDLLKVNIEGSEFLIIPYLIQSGVIKKIKHLQVQFHTFYPNAESLRRDIRQELAHTHTEKWNYFFVWESWTQL